MHGSKKHFFFSANFTSKTKKFVIFFKKISFIRSYLILKHKKENKFFFKIFPNYYKNLKPINNFYLFSTIKKKLYISLKALFLLSKRSGAATYLLSTSQGLITHQTALKKKISGILIGFFYN